MAPPPHPRRARSLVGLLSLTATAVAACSPAGCAPAGPEGRQGEEVRLAATPKPSEALDVRTLHRGEHAEPEASGQTPVDPADLDLPYGEIINPSRKVLGSLSMGNTSSGSLVKEATMPAEGEHHGVIPSCRERSTSFGTEELVEVIMHAGKAVTEAHGEGGRLMVCNMAQEGGGDIRWSRSHNSGRDADLAFYAKKGGRSVDSPALLRFGGDLKSIGTEGYTFDVARNWTQVKALLTHPTIYVQWLFISNPLKDALLTHARERGEPEEVIERAETVLWQPTDSSPHNDHLHLRIYCSRQDALEGCIDTGPRWAWVDTHKDAREARALALARGLKDEDPEVRAEVLAFLDKIRGVDAAASLAEVALVDPEVEIREGALDLIARWRNDDPDVLRGLERVIRTPGGGIVVDDPGFTRTNVGPQLAAAGEPLPEGSTPEPLEVDEVRTGDLLLDTWRTYGLLANEDALPFLLKALTSRRRLGDGDDGVAEPGLAALAARHLDDLELVPPLIDLLDHEDPKARERAALTLRRITNHSFEVDWEDEDKPSRRARAVERWRTWWASNKDKDRQTLLLEGFRRGGVKIDSLAGWDTVDALIKVTRRDDHLGYNADRVVAARTGRWSPRDGRAERKYRRWRKWWRKNERRVRARWDK